MLIQSTTVSGLLSPYALDAVLNLTLAVPSSFCVATEFPLAMQMQEKSPWRFLVTGELPSL